MTKVEQEDSIASLEEVSAALAAMSKAEMARLAKFARLRALAASSIDWEDLIHEAFLRALKGTRRWPKRISFRDFLLGTIRSVAFEYKRSTHGREIPLSTTGSATEFGDEPSIEVADDSPSPEEEVIARRTLSSVRALFEDDRSALAVLSGLAEGAGPAEVQKNAGISPRQYASAQRRIRRVIARAIEEKEL